MSIELHQKVIRMYPWHFRNDKGHPSQPTTGLGHHCRHSLQYYNCLVSASIYFPLKPPPHTTPVSSTKSVMRMIDEDDSPAQTAPDDEDSSLSFPEVFDDDDGRTPCCSSFDDSMRVAGTERPYRVLEQQREARQVRRMQREARAEKNRRKERRGSFWGSTRREDDPEQPQEEGGGGEEEDLKAAAAGAASSPTDDNITDYLVGAECQIGALMLMLICTCVAVGLLNRHVQPNSNKSDSFDGDREVAYNLTNALTKAPQQSVEPPVPTTTIPSTSTTNGPVATTATTAPPPIATTTITTSATTAQPTDDDSLPDNGPPFMIEQDLFVWMDESANNEYYAVHAEGTIVSLRLTLSPDSPPHSWYLTTTLPAPALGDGCGGSSQLTDTSTTMVEMTTDSALVVCQDDSVVATSTHVFASGWDTARVSLITTLAFDLEVHCIHKFVLNILTFLGIVVLQNSRSKSFGSRRSQFATGTSAQSRGSSPGFGHSCARIQCACLSYSSITTTAVTATVCISHIKLAQPRR